MEIFSALLLLLSNSMGINNVTFQFMNGIATTTLNSFMGYLAESFYIVLPLIALYMIYRKDRNVYPFVLAAILLFVVGYGLKTAFHEPRPCSLPQYNWINQPSCESGYSFPSDHATVLTGLVLFLGARKRIRALYIIWLALELFGRVYLGQHYLTDVIVGIAISLIIAYVIYRYKDKVFALASKLGLTFFTERGGRQQQRQATA